MATRCTTVAGLDLYWRELGAGDPLVFVHGIGISGRYLLPTAELVAPQGAKDILRKSQLARTLYHSTYRGMVRGLQVVSGGKR